MAASASEARLPRVNSASRLLSLISHRSPYPLESQGTLNGGEQKNPFLLKLPNKADLKIESEHQTLNHDLVGLSKSRRDRPMSISKSKFSGAPYPFRKNSDYAFAQIMQRSSVRQQLEILRAKGVKVEGRALRIEKTKSCQGSPARTSHRSSPTNLISARGPQSTLYRSSSITRLNQGRLADIFRSHKVDSNIKLGVVSTQLRRGRDA